MRKQLRLFINFLLVKRKPQQGKQSISKPFPPHPLTQRDSRFHSGYKLESTLSSVGYLHSAFQGSNWQRALRPVVLVAFDFTTKCRTKTTWEKKSSFVHSFIVHPTLLGSDPYWPKGWDIVYDTGLLPERINLPRLGTKHSLQAEDGFCSRTVQNLFCSIWKSLKISVSMTNAYHK